ncbi:hypothetical protein D3Z53_22325 [Lachnospiraceae bacterium]|jgi:hypothetical protein|nr:hypothetical protein [uncultured Schaedlerella sp.]MCI9152587.1 hypothetical protein [Ruminococcus sp.]NBI60708.1 hypothetical protein [Lachnospiraceae bacterium]
MENLYWIAEYGKVFFGWLFLMFLWPSVVFGGHLKEKTRAYRFSFCVTVQIVIINSVVLVLGLLHILHQAVVVILFYGIFFYALWKRQREFRCAEKSSDVQKKSRRNIFCKAFLPGICDHISVRHVFRNFGLRVKEQLWECRKKIHPWIQQYGLPGGVLLFGMVYFSYGAFQVHSYGWGDLYVHHEWIYGLINGEIFSGGVYPEAMHCFIYVMSVLFGIRVYSILLFLQGIHVAVFLLSAYLLLREVFHWKYSSVFVLMLFLTVDVVSAEHIYSMFRLQITLPLEFGLHLQFLCALYLVRYLKKESLFRRKGKTSKYYWDEDLFLFMMSLTASIATHFYVVIMAFILCASFALFALKKVFDKKYLIPLTASVVCGIMIAVTPMAGALASGIPFNYSIDWAVDVLEGEESRRLQEKVDADQEAGDGTEEIRAKAVGLVNWAECKEKCVHFIKKTLPELYRNGYPALYGEGRTRWILGLTGIAVLLCLAARLRPFGRLNRICSGYLPLILFNFLFMVIYAMPFAGYPELIGDSRFCSAGHMMVLAVTVMPIDAVFSLLLRYCSVTVLKRASAAAVLGIYAGALLLGNYRGFLFYELTRYNSTVKVTNSIIDSFPKKGYTIVAPTDELYPVILDGWHEELKLFAEKCTDPEYTLPTEYVFIYIEKKPLLYAQSHFFRGPFWLGEEKYMDTYWKRYSKKYPYSGASQSPEIKTAEITKKTEQDTGEESDNEWHSYTRLEERTKLEAQVYDWCRRFSEIHPSVLDVYYEDEDFVCYYFRQDPERLYHLGIKEHVE